MGLASCPCDGQLDPRIYRSVTDRLIGAIDDSPHLLLDPLTERMERLAREQRYEEAAWARDRHEALVRSLRQRRQWQALAAAGWLEVESADGTTAVIDHGTFVETRPPGLPPRLDHQPSDPIEMPMVAPTVEAAEEAALIWRWLETNEAKLVECTGTLAYPLHQVKRLSVPRRVAA
jgi:DNA polymerase-3 subunit epsilon